MDRRTVLLASAGAVHIAACGGEPDEALGETQQAMITPSLLIQSLKYSGTMTGSLMKLTVQLMPDLYLRTITLAKGEPGAATAGKLVKGTLTNPGIADATISAEYYDSILADSKVAALTIELQYTGKSVIRNVFVENV